MLRMWCNKPGTGLGLMFAMLWTSAGQALQPLSLHELVSHCKQLAKDAEGVDGQYCIRYIQGFIDGAVETDDRILQELGQQTGNMDALTERALRNRMPRRGSYDRPGSLAGFCLSDPIPLRDVIDTVVADLIARDIGETAESPARVAVEDSLRNHYPCEE